jgi:hypothetical protein
VLGVFFDYSHNTLKKHIENQFTKGMSWGNILNGQIHIDHIIPLATAKNKEDLLMLCFYRNLQPLWAKDNMAKKAKIIEGMNQISLNI